MKLDWSRLDGIRAKAHASITKLPGKAGELARKANEALGRPLADETELADRRAFDLLCETNRVPLCETIGFALLSVNVAISSGNLFLSRSLIDEIGPFADYRYNHDWEYCLRALKRAEPAWVQEPLYRYRLHGANTITESPKAARDEAAQVCGAYLRWAIAERTPANPFAPALANWGRLFVNAMLLGGMGELLTADELRQLVGVPSSAAPLA